MEIKPIKTEQDYEAALATMETLWNAPEGSAKADRLEVLFTLVEKYEEEHFPIDEADPVAVIEFRLEQMGETPKILEAALGGRVKVWEVLNRRRPLTLAMIARLSELGIPADALVRGVVAGTGRAVSRGKRRVAARPQARAATTGPRSKPKAGSSRVARASAKRTGRK